jgi:uncharacterized protein (TIGR03545 family)
MSEKKMKKVGPIRTGAVIPFVIFTVTVVVFNMFFLDMMIKKSIEYVGTQINGAEVNVGSVETSFKELKIVIRKVQFTNVQDPKKNVVEIGEIRFSMLWDALLRAKIVIQESVIKDILMDTKRSHTGYVVPPEPPSTEESKVAQEALLAAKKEFSGNVFGDIAALLAGEDSKDLMNKMMGELQSKKYIEELQATVKLKEEQMEGMMKSLPKSQVVAQYDDRIKAIDWNGLKDLKKAPKILKEAKQLKEEISSTVNQYEAAAKIVKSDLQYLKDSTKQAEKLVKDDINALGDKIALPNLDPETISKMLFGPEFLAKVESYKKYADKAKEYMPPKKTAEEKAQFKPQRPPRGQGKNYSFGRPNSYPLFWLKLASINSKNDQGTVVGKIENLSSDQKWINRPATMEVKAEFPPLSIYGVESKMTFDMRDELLIKSENKVAAFPIVDQVLSKSDDVTFNIKKSTGSTQLDFIFQNAQINMNMKNQFKDIEYETMAKAKLLNEVLAGVAQDTTFVTLDANATGAMGKLSFRVRSNVGDEINKSVKRQMQKKIDEAKAKIKADIDRQIAGKKAEIDQKIAGMTSKFNGELDKNKEKINGLIAKIEGNEKAGNKIDPKEALKKLKTKFKL